MARRGNNEGSIYKRADGRWAAVVDLGWQDGKRKRKTFYAKTRGEVREQLTKALSDHQKALPVTSDRLTTGQFLNSWLVDTVKASVRPRTYQSYTELVRVHLGPGLGRIPLAKLSPEDVESSSTGNWPVACLQGGSNTSTLSFAGPWARPRSEARWLGTWPSSCPPLE